MTLVHQILSVDIRRRSCLAMLPASDLRPPWPIIIIVMMTMEDKATGQDLVRHWAGTRHNPSNRVMSRLRSVRGDSPLQEGRTSIQQSIHA